MRIVEMGPLRARITGGTDREGGGDGPVVVLLHGFGAPGDDLVALWRVLGAPPGTRFVFPEAPLSLREVGYGEGRAWWMIDMQQMIELQRGKPRDGAKLREAVPEGIDLARANVVAMLDAVEATLAPKGLVLGGFSQGAMLSCDVALRTDRRLAGLVLMSGALISEPEWVPLFPTRKGLRVIESHGASDALLPYANAEALRDHMKAAEWDVTWVPFRGGHEIPGKVLDEVGGFLQRVLA